MLRNTVEVFRLLLREGKASKAKGLDPDQAKAAILPALEPLMMRMTAGAPRAVEAFKIYLVDWYLHRVYDELDGQVTDAIAPIPPK